MHTLPNLPYAIDALTPHISKETLEFHHGKHHQAYVTNLNNLLPGTGLENDSLEDIIKKTHNDTAKVGIFNNAAQVWNHTFFWSSMKPNGGGKPTGRLLDMINASFGSYEEFVTQFKQAAATQFGSGWAWLVQEDDTLKIVKTGNAGTPLVDNCTPLMTCDVWEHAYYLDFQNRRPDYVATFLDHLVNWDFASSNLAN
jgi:superoxide dismutase, Fe-Mn family